MTPATALQSPAPQQALLPGLTPPPDQPARFAVLGVLRERARVYPMPSGTVLLQVEIAQSLAAHPEAAHVLATYHYPDDGCPATTLLAAQTKAAGMRMGAEVIALGSALYPGHHQGQPVLVLANVAGIALQHPAPLRTAGTPQ